MDLLQRKLTKDEWDSIERPITSDELRIVKLISDGYNNVNIKKNTTSTLLQYLKVANSKEIDTYIYVKYLESNLKKALKYASDDIILDKTKLPKRSIKKKDIMRFNHADTHLDQVKDTLYEYIIIDMVKTTLKQKHKNNCDWVVGFYTLTKMIKYSVHACNRNLFSNVEGILDTLGESLELKSLVYNSVNLIEKNQNLLKYADEQLYDHQKKLFTTIKNVKTPQLVLYIAPTGTGKTISPIGLLQGKRVIFVCAARHVGLALAKSCISAERKVAFAFGCNDAQDIRLHYSAAKEYTKHRKTGGIFRVDNSVGDNVEIMISDVRSYIPAMLYMCAFNEKKDLVTYWDEPTITMDYQNHECHEMIKRNWTENVIPNFVLSSATLPNEQELAPTIRDFMARFENARVTTITSYDCKKTIPMINRNGLIEAPHFMYGSDYDKTKECAEYCKKNPTLLRYIDLGEISHFISAVCEEFPSAISKKRYNIERQFTDIDDVNMSSIKLYYLELLSNLKKNQWANISEYISTQREKRHESNIYISTKDAYTLTDGPTIYLAEDVSKISKFCLQSANIPVEILQEIQKAINFNNIINKKISVLEKNLEDKTAADEEAGKEKKLSSNTRGDPEVKELRRKIAELQNCVLPVRLPDAFIPNMAEHIKRFAANKDTTTVFKPTISEETVEKIMLVDDVDDSWKVLLMMGIGVFGSDVNDNYTVIMKQLAQEQKLYLIIASTDYIYGTNYQFCHGYIGKDLGLMSQEKAIQAMGRVGRNKLQYDYTLRFRDDNIIRKLFEYDDNKPEVMNMAKLFNS